MTEKYKSKCLNCGIVYQWSSPEPGTKPSPEQSLEAMKDLHTCRQCGSKELVTGINWTRNKYPDSMKGFDPELKDFSVFSENEALFASKMDKDINISAYECRHCAGEHNSLVGRWEDTDGEFLLLYCNDCWKRFAVERDTAVETLVRQNQVAEQGDIIFVTPKVTLHNTGLTADDDDYVFTAVAPLINPKLIHVDPLDPDLDEETKQMILTECSMNFWYFAQNILKVESSNYDIRFISCIVEKMYKLRAERVAAEKNRDILTIRDISGLLDKYDELHVSENASHEYRQVFIGTISELLLQPDVANRVIEGLSYLDEGGIYITLKGDEGEKTSCNDHGQAAK